MDLDAFCSCDVVTYPFHAKVVKARKEHECLECCHKIQPGEKYERVGGRCEDEWWSGSLCLGCLAMLDFVRAHIPCVCVSYGNMVEELTELCQEASREAPGLLFGFYRRMLSRNRPSTRNAND